MKKILPLLLLFALLGGCTGSCGGTTNEPEATPVRTPRPTATASTAPLPSPTPTEPDAVRPVPTHTLPPATLEPAVQHTPTPRPSATPTPTPTLVPVPTATPAPSPEYTAEVLEAYTKATEAFGWFHIATLRNTEETQTYNGQTYYKVDESLFSTLAQLRGYLRTLFSDELVDGLLPEEGGLYLELEGGLYVLPGGREADITKGEERYEVVLSGGGKITLRVTVDLLDAQQDYAVVGSETHSFPYERVGDKWIFTDFYLFR